MASTGKKGKKSKGVTLGLGDFLAAGQEDVGSGQTVIMVPKGGMGSSSWADEMESEETYAPPISKERIILPSAPRAARGGDLDENKLPRNPPYTAYLANLPFDIDTEDIVRFFKGLKIVSVRLPRDGGTDSGRLRGFGYAEFEERQELVEALGMSDLMIKNRKIRIDVAGQNDEEDKRGPRKPRDREEQADRTPDSDWRSAPREGPPPSDRREQEGGFGRDRFGGGDRDRDRGGFGRGPPREERYESSFGSRDERFSRGSNFEQRRDDRFGGDKGSGGRFERGGNGGFDRGGGGGGFKERDYGDRERGGFGSGGGGPRREFRERGGEEESDERFSGLRERREPEREPEREREREAPSAPKERPRLVLAPRSVAAAPKEEVDAPASTATQASIFGGAKPVDTTAREKEIEQRLRKKEEEKLQEEPRRIERDRPVSRGESEGRERERRDSERTRSPSPPPSKGEKPRVQLAPLPKESAWSRKLQVSPQEEREEEEHEEKPAERERERPRDEDRPRDRDYREKEGYRDYREKDRDVDRDRRHDGGDRFRDRPSAPRDRDTRGSYEARRGYDDRPKRGGGDDYPRGGRGDYGTRRPDYGRDERPRGEYRGRGGGGGDRGHGGPPQRHSDGNRDRYRNDHSGERYNRDRDERPAPRRHSPERTSSKEATIKKYEDPRPPVFTDGNKFTLLGDSN